MLVAAGRSRKSGASHVVPAVALAYLTLAAPLCAQDQPEVVREASFTTGVSFGDGDTALALNAGLAFRLTDRIGLDLEIAYARKLDFTLDLCPAPRVCALDGHLPVTGRTVSLVPHLTIDVAPSSRRFRAYALAGVGGGHVRQRYFFAPDGGGSAVDPPEFTRSSVTLALSFGGAVMVRLSRQLSVGADVRSLLLRDDQAPPDRFIQPAGTLTTLRVGSRVSWRF